VSEAAGASGGDASATRRVLLAQAYGFCLMCAYGLLKPLRDDLAVQFGFRNIPWLWAGTLVVTVVLLPPYWRLVAALPRQRVIAWVNRCVALSLVVFYALFRGEQVVSFKLNDVGWIDTTFGGIGWLHGGPLAFPLVPLALYVWISVFNLLVLSLFWSVMADRHDADQGKRLFGPIAIGITLGAITGSIVVLEFVDELKTYGLLLVSAALLELATWTGRRVAGEDPAPLAAKPTVGAGEAVRRWFAGFAAVSRSPYLAGLIGYQFLSIATATMVYTQRTELMETSGLAREQRTAFNGWNDLATQTVALLLQALVASRLLRRAGVGVALAIQMVIAIVGFVAIGLVVDGGGTIAADAGWRSLLWLPGGALPIGLAAVLLFAVVLKGVEFGLSKPSRETLFTVVTRDEKYQAKSLIDTGLYRAFDQVTSVGTTWMRVAPTAASSYGLGLALSSCAFAMAPVMGIGVVLAFWLGRAHAKRAAAAANAASATPAASSPADRDLLPKT